MTISTLFQAIPTILFPATDTPQFDSSFFHLKDLQNFTCYFYCFLPLIPSTNFFPLFQLSKNNFSLLFSNFLLLQSSQFLRPPHSYRSQLSYCLFSSLSLSHSLILFLLQRTILKWLLDPHHQSVWRRRWCRREEEGRKEGRKGNKRLQVEEGGGGGEEEVMQGETKHRRRRKE